MFFARLKIEAGVDANIFSESSGKGLEVAAVIYCDTTQHCCEVERSFLTLRIETKCESTIDARGWPSCLFCQLGLPINIIPEPMAFFILSLVISNPAPFDQSSQSPD
jgi:hypothetical protein